MEDLKPQPAASVIAKFGGINETAEAVGLDRSVVNRWLRPKEKGGTDGLIPSKHQAKLLAAARERQIELAPGDLIDAA